MTNISQNREQMKVIIAYGERDFAAVFSLFEYFGWHLSEYDNPAYGQGMRFRFHSIDGESREYNGTYIHDIITELKNVVDKHAKEY